MQVDETAEERIEFASHVELSISSMARYQILIWVKRSAKRLRDSDKDM